MTDREDLLAVGGAFDGKTLSIGTREWEVATWKPAPVALALYDIARMPDPVSDAYGTGIRTSYRRTRFTLFPSIDNGGSNAWAWVLVPEGTLPGQAEANTLTEAMIRGLAAAFAGAARRWVTFADNARAVSDEINRFVQARVREADERIMRSILDGTPPLPSEDDPVFGGIMRRYPQRWTDWRDFADDEPEPAHDYTPDACACPSCADACWRCDAAPAATDVGLCEPCRDDLREPVAA